MTERGGIKRSGTRPPRVPPRRKGEAMELYAPTDPAPSQRASALVSGCFGAAVRAAVELPAVVSTEPDAASGTGAPDV